jgi:hypothetical protein
MSTTAEVYEWIEWTPRWVGPHVHGRYTKRTFDEGMPEPQIFKCRCDKCGATWQGECLSGAVRHHIGTFASQHTHEDPLKAPRIERPGSLRRGGNDDDR